MQKLRQDSCPLTVMFYCVFCYVCVLLCPFLFPYRGGKTRDLSSARKTDHTDFTERMSYLPSNFMAEISPEKKALVGYVNPFRTSLRENQYLGIIPK